MSGEESLRDSSSAASSSEISLSISVSSPESDFTEPMPIKWSYWKGALALPELLVQVVEADLCLLGSCFFSSSKLSDGVSDLC